MRAADRRRRRARRRPTAAPRDPAWPATCCSPTAPGSGDPALLERTGLTAAQPPAGVHAMAQGPLAAAGGLYEADMVANALASAGVDIAGALGAALDFGCSSGRVLRVLAAAFPDVRWIGCDPNARRDRLGAGDASRSSSGSRAPTSRRCALARRRARPGLRDLDLVALRAAASDCAGSRRCAACSAPAGIWCSPTHGWTALAYDARDASGARWRSASRSSARSTATATGSSTASARPATGAS